MTVVLLNHGVIRDHIASVHREGCRDIRRDQLKHGSQLHRFDSLEDALSDFIDSEMEEQGWSRADVKVHNCTREAGHVR